MESLLSFLVIYLVLLVAFADIGCNKMSVLDLPEFQKYLEHILIGTYIYKNKFDILLKKNSIPFLK